MKSAFGIFDYSMIPKIRRLLKPYGLALKVKRSTRYWGDQVEVSIEKLSETKRRKARTRNTQPVDAGIGMSGIQMGN